METIFAVYIGFIGLAIGSFLNVVIARVPDGLSVVRPRSRCPKCGHQLPWYENIPVVSWLMLRGKCSGCGTPISPRYILVELLTGILFLTCVARFGFTWSLVPALIFVSLLIPLIFIDAAKWILPFELTIPGIIFGIVLQVPRDLQWDSGTLSHTPGFPALTTAIIGTLAGYLAFRLMEFFGWLGFRKEALGGGDKFLLAMIGGFLGGPALFGVIALSSFQGALYGIVMMLIYGRAGPEVEAKQPADASAPPVDTASAAPVDPLLTVADPAHTLRVTTGADQVPSVPPVVEEEELELTFTFEFAKPGLSIGRRFLMIPYAFLLQPIPDMPEGLDEDEEEDEWVPGPTNIPFGPWLGLAALEVMLIGPWASAHVTGPWSLFVKILLGQWS